MIDRRLLMNFDWTLLITTLVISSLGVMNIYSSVYPYSGGGTPLYLKQVYWLILAVVLMASILSLDYRTLIRYGYLFYLIRASRQVPYRI